MTEAYDNPATIGKRYLLHEKLGEGGMDEVFHATDRLTRGDVALKRVTLPTENLMFTSRRGSTDVNIALAHLILLLGNGY